MGNRLARMLVVEKCLDRARHDVADAFDGIQIFHRVLAFHGFEESIDRMKIAGEQLGRCLADMGDG